jgi:hypothetical protein
MKPDRRYRNDLMRGCVAVILWSVISMGPLAAQGSPPVAGPRVASHWSERWDFPSFSTAPLMSTPARALSHQAKWTLGGAVVAGIASANALCEHTGCTGPTRRWGLIGAGVGAVLGSIIGKATDRKEKS